MFEKKICKNIFKIGNQMLYTIELDINKYRIKINNFIILNEQIRFEII